MWIWLGVVSMLFLGVYDLCKKHALNHNAVLPTLFFSNLAGLSLVLPLLFFADVGISLGQHGLIACKSLLVGCSWICAYFALKHLPISIVAPIRASAPMWTLAGAMLLYGEQPTPPQWVGMGLIFFGYFAFALLGREEGIHFHRSKWVGLIFLATLLGTCSGLYDKWLIQRAGIPPRSVLSWYYAYLSLLFTLLNGLLWWPNRHQTTPFQWRWSIPFIGILLVLSDAVYFRALQDPEALIVILSLLRRSCVLISFSAGAFLFKEVNKRKKGWVLLAILTGVLLILLSGN